MFKLDTRRDGAGPQPGGAAPGRGRRHLAQARQGGAQRPRATSSWWTWAPPTARTSTASRSTSRRSHDGDKIQIGSNTVLKFSIQDQLEEQYQRSIYESATRDGLTRHLQQEVLPGHAPQGVRVLPAPPGAAVAGDVRRRSLQEDQRHLRPPGRRLRAARASPQRVIETVRTEDLLRALRRRGVRAACCASPPRTRRCAAPSAAARRSTRADFIFGGTPIKVTISLGVATLLRLGLRAARGPDRRRGQVPVPRQARRPEPGGRDADQRAVEPLWRLGGAGCPGARLPVRPLPREIIADAMRHDHCSAAAHACAARLCGGGNGLFAPY